jgi:hypothetical protein
VDRAVPVDVVGQVAAQHNVATPDPAVEARNGPQAEQLSAAERLAGVGLRPAALVVGLHGAADSIHTRWPPVRPARSIGSLLDLDGHWQRFDKVRILMGDEISHRMKKALLVAVKERAEERLDESLEDDKERDPFLTGVDAIVAALASGQIEGRVYNKDRFRAKTYITHGRFEV